MKYQYSLLNSGPWYDEGTGPIHNISHDKNVSICGFKIEWREKTEEEVIQWKDGIHKEGMETVYYSQTRRFVLRMTDDEFGEPYPVWILESHRPKRCCVCGTTENLRKDGWYGYRCDKASCVPL